MAKGKDELARAGGEADPAGVEAGPAGDEADAAGDESGQGRDQGDPGRDESDPDAGRPALPDRLSVDPDSPYHVPTVFEHAVGIRFNGRERFGVEEYCRSEGWIKVAAGKALDRRGRPMLIKLKGEVEPFYK
jgi:hypothetical protein